MELEKEVENIIEKIESKGYEAYIVGGAVRDYLMGNESTDIDIATSATPQEIKEIFKEVHDTGIDFGTVTVVQDRGSYEITTYRTESSYGNGRHPDSVEYTRSLKEDLSRRDLTINSMAYNPNKGIQDYFGGYRDIQDKVIRCVGDPEERFREDYLRILRAIRFESQLDFKMEPKTVRGYRRNIKGLENVSKERIRKEVGLLFAGEGVERVVRDRSDVLEQIYGGTIQRGVAAKIRDYSVGYVLELSKERTQKETEEKMRELRYPNNEIKWVTLIKTYEEQVRAEKTKVGIKKIMSKIGKEEYKEVLNYTTSKGYNTDIHHTKVEEIETNKETTQLKELVINGKDIQDLGYKGKDIGVILERVLEQVIKGELTNEKRSIKTYVKES